MKKPIERPVGQVYYYIAMNIDSTSFEIRSHWDYHHDLENKRYDMGNYFVNRSDALKRLSELNNAFAL